MDESNVAAHLARNLIGLRSVRRLTQDGLAKQSGVPRSTIANLESGDGNPSLAVLTKVAGALGVPIDELLAAPRAKVRKWSQADLPVQHSGQGVTVRPLVPEPVPEEMLTVMEFAIDSAMRGSPHLPGTREYFTCLEGRVQIVVAGDRYELGPGDVLGFPGNLPHSYRNADAGRAASGVSVVVLAKAGV
ncbi:XRE family transcriptional regulator [Oxalobacteraceae bacterium OM1]|nr:XRE family transcriptional regulator [Oxalobacteraceae bacterium OM1]